MQSVLTIMLGYGHSEYRDSITDGIKIKINICFITDDEMCDTSELAVFLCDKCSLRLDHSYLI